MTDDIGSATLARIRNIAAERVTRINETTRDKIRSAIAEGVDKGEGMAQLGARIASSAAFDPYRGELIARTETMHAWNASSIESYRDAGVQMVEPQDGDKDPSCAARMARGAVTLEEALGDEDHPNGTLSWVPVVDYARLREQARELGLSVAPQEIVETGMGARARAALGPALTVRDHNHPIVQQHLSELDKVNPDLLKAFAGKGGKVVLGRGPVTDFDPTQRGVVPRGWEKSGRTWDDVPGFYHRALKTVYAGNEGGHGCRSLVLHELGHGMDDLLGKPSFGSRFTVPWRLIKNKLDPYLRQEGGAGMEETWAESFARYHLGGKKFVSERFGRKIAEELDLWIREELWR